jgi:hypothetical protein
LRDSLTGLRGGPKRVVARPLCAKCSKPVTLVELVPPGRLPHDFETWPESLRSLYREYYNGNAHWHFLFRGIEGGNGIGDGIDAARAFTTPLTFAKVHAANLFDDAGFCEECDAAYCYTHWHDDKVGQFCCPRGHWKSLDPRWSPD